MKFISNEDTLNIRIDTNFDMVEDNYLSFHCKGSVKSGNKKAIKALAEYLSETCWGIDLYEGRSEEEAEARLLEVAENIFAIAKEGVGEGNFSIFSSDGIIPNADFVIMQDAYLFGINLHMV